jgi:hypothetical protein
MSLNNAAGGSTGETINLAIDLGGKKSLLTGDRASVEALIDALQEAGGRAL